MPILYTQRLTLVPFTLEMVQAAMNDRAALAQLIDGRIHEDWPLADLYEVLPIFANIFAQHPEASERHRLILHTAERLLIGDIGFRQIDMETWEIGYGIVPAYRRQGYTLEAARALVAWAFEYPEVQRVTAECFTDNLGSIVVLERLGLRRVGAKDDLILWELTRAGA